MGLAGMAQALREQLEQSQYHELSFEERLGLLVDRELAVRDNRRLATRLKAARLRQPASVEDLDFRVPRGLDRGLVLSLAQAGWVESHHNLLLSGPTGVGKSFIACALAQAAIRRGHTPSTFALPACSPTSPWPAATAATRACSPSSPRWRCWSSTTSCSHPPLPR